MIIRCIALLLVVVGCVSKPKTSATKEIPQVENQPPNILWIVTEDISPDLSFYGDATAKTPFLDALSKESVIYDNAFAVVGVCGPSRSSIITGMYPTTLGTMHMRTGKDIQSWGKRVYNKDTGRADSEGTPIIEYSAVIPAEVVCFTQYLRAAGYYTTNNQKTDYQFAAPVTAWDENNTKAHWRNRPADTPFFSVFNIALTHESQLWKSQDLPLTVTPEAVEVPPYLPDNEATRNTIARHYSNIERMDKKVGELLNQLKADGLYDNTIIFFYSDHGGPLPREKREIYDSGLKVPFIIKDVNGSNGRTDQLISFVDLAPTLLSIANIEPPQYLEGKAFLGKYNTKARNYIYGTSDRFDEFTDRSRAVRTKEFLYVYNDYPEKTKYKDVGYRKNIPMMPVFLELKDNNELDADEQKWFATKEQEELYDVKADPYSMNNLASNPEYKAVLLKMRTLLQKERVSRPDLGLQPEAQLINKMWPNFIQPKTAAVQVGIENGTATLSTVTEGASIGYKISKSILDTFDFNSGWQLYSKPIKLEKGDVIHCIAQRIGYKESGISKVVYETN